MLGAYFATAQIGVPLAFWHPALTDLWAPTAIALVAVLLWGYVMLPAVALAGVLWCATRAMPVAVVVGVPLAVTITAALAVALLRLFDFDPRLARVRDVIALAGFARSATVRSTFHPYSRSSRPTTSRDGPFWNGNAP